VVLILASVSSVPDLEEKLFWPALYTLRVVASTTEPPEIRPWSVLNTLNSLQCVYIHTCIHAYIRAYIHEHIHAYIFTNMHTDIHIYTCINPIPKTLNTEPPEIRPRSVECES
jgi:hypothetical protein